jgi:hypothetical protein
MIFYVSKKRSMRSIALEIIISDSLCDFSYGLGIRLGVSHTMKLETILVGDPWQIGCLPLASVQQLSLVTADPPSF